MATDFMTLKATLGLDSSEYEKGLGNAEGKAKGFGSKWGAAMKVVTAGAVAIGTATVAVAGLAKKSLDSYAEYEQMVGGVKKLYGNMGLSLDDYAKSVGKSVDEVKGQYNQLEKAQDLVLKNAQQAYKTTGMSANEYMSTATSFSAALINSLEGDTVAAAKQTDVAMRAISDNFNTFGGDISMIQGAFQGFAKQNYTMLDNLKLGYGGTKTEMERLIADANAYAEANGKAADLSIDSFADIVTAIDLIQQKQQIAGTTAREASTTIEGSLMTVKAAWQNLLTGFADPDANIADLTQNLVEAVGVAASNIGPALIQALQGIGEAFSVILPELIAGIPSAIEKYGEPLVAAGANLVKNLVQGLTDSGPKIIETAFKLVGDLLLGLAQKLPSIIIGGINLITGLIQGLTDGSGDFVDKFGEILATLGTAIVDAAPALGEALLNLLKALGEMFAEIDWISLGAKAFEGIKSGMEKIAPLLKTVVKGAVKSVLNLLGFSGIASKVRNAFQKVVDAAKDKMESAKKFVKDKVTAIKNMFPFNIGKIFSGLKLPHFSVSGGSAPWGIGGKGKMPSFSVSWYRKALDNPYIFTSPTMFDLKMAGEAGDEMLYGRSALMRDIREAAGGSGDINIYLNYNAGDDVNDMLKDIARGMQRYKMAGVI